MDRSRVHLCLYVTVIFQMCDILKLKENWKGAISRDAESQSPCDTKLLQSVIRPFSTSVTGV